MTTDERLDVIANKLDEMQAQSTKDKRENVSYILWGFTLAVLAFALTNPSAVYIVVTLVFFFMGWAMWFRARAVKMSQPKNARK